MNAAQERLGALAARRPVALAELRGALDEAREALYADLSARWPAPGHASARLTAVMDALCAALFTTEAAPYANPPALLATGGYGRGELCPGSDLDLLVVYAGPSGRDAAERVATAFFQTLWDLGLKLGHAVRPLGDVPQAFAADLHTATNLSEARYLAGDSRLHDALEAEVGRLLTAEATAVGAAKLAELDALHARYGDSPFRTQPHVKAGAAGLRDHEALRLLERAGLGPGAGPAAGAAPAGGAPALPPDERRALGAEHRRLLDLRFAMHLVEGRKQDLLSFEIQPDVAGLVTGHRPAPRHVLEAYMRRHYQSAGLAVRALRLGREGLDERLRRERPDPVALRPVRLTDRLVRVGERLELAHPEALQAAPATDLVGVFLLAQREKLAIAPSVEEAVLRERPHLRPEDVEDPACMRAFRDLLGGRTGVADALEAMHRTGLLGEVLPEVGALHGLYLRDPYHALTVDAHSIEAARMLERFAESSEREDQVRAEVLSRSPHTDILRLACLAHDMGKGRGGDHVRAGARMVADLVRRLGLDLFEGRLLRFLVEEHMLLSETAERRDPQRPETLARVAERVKTEDRLDLLYLLTAADARAAGPHGFPRWKDALVGDLTRRLREVLRGASPGPVDAATHRRETLALLEPDLGEADYDAHTALAPRRYLLEVEPFEVAQHLALVARLAAGDDPAIARGADGPLHHLWVVTGDRTGLFALMAGAIAATHASIIAADAYTRRDGIVLDKLTLAFPERLADDPEVWRRLTATLTAALRGDSSVEALLERSRARIDPYADATLMPAAPPLAGEGPRPRSRGPLQPPTVALSNKLSDRYTVVDVVAPDRLGLLYDLCLCLARAGVDIHGAKVATRADRAIDVFYVTREGSKLEGADTLDTLRAALLAAAGGSERAAEGESEGEGTTT